MFATLPLKVNCAIVFGPCFVKVFLQKISRFSKQMRPNLPDTLSLAAEKNAQRNKLSLHPAV